MAKGLQKSIQDYLSRHRKSNQPIQSPSNQISSGGSRLLTACKYPKTPSFAEKREETNAAVEAATLKDIDQFLFENFNSLYKDGTGVGEEQDGKWRLSGESESPTFVKTPPSLRSSHRFFVPSGDTNSLVSGSDADVARSSSSSTPGDAILPDESFPLLTYSWDPYGDFRRSMEEMVEARHMGGSGPLDWDFMEELLFSYLKLNEKRAHKFILGAFVDLTISLRREEAAAVRGRRRRRKQKSADVILAGERR